MSSLTTLSLTRGSRVRLDCELAIRHLAKCRHLALTLMHAQAQAHCDFTTWKLHRASRITADINRAISQLDATLNMQVEETVVTLADLDEDALPAEPHWLVSRAQSGAEYMARTASRPLVATAYAAASGAKQSAITTYAYVRPRIVCAVQYVVSPSGFLNIGATASALASLQLATLATTCSTASVGANGLAAVLQTSAEVIQATGDTGAIRQALRDPSYAKELQQILNQRRQVKQRRRLVDTLTAWASLVNSGPIAMLSPTASKVVAGTGARFARLVCISGAEAPVNGDGETASWDVHGAAVSRRSYLLESTRLALFVNSWVSTTLHGKVHTLRDTPDNAVQFLVSVAGNVSEYRQLGWYDGSQAAYRDVIGPAFNAAAATGLTLGRQACGSAWHCVTHPFSTLSSVIRPGAAAS